MCRMIAAVGAVEPPRLLEAARRMAANENPAHTHEKRSEGAAFRHEDGWGAAWNESGGLKTVRRTVSILADRRADRVLGEVATPLLLIHARRASRGRPRLRNTHPFTAQFLGRAWAFCHNGTIEDPSVLQRVPGLVLGGGTDSEHLFHHLLNRIGASYAGDLRAVLEPSAREAISRLTTYTAAHCFLATSDRIVAAAARHPERSHAKYHALWEGCAANLHVVSSEPVDGLGCAWRRIPEPGVVLMEAVQ
jgi:predicted glutamine amidotransferase